MAKRLDSHQHFWNYDPQRYSWIDDSMADIRRNFFPEDLDPVLQENNMDGCIAVQADQSEEETEFLLRLASEHDFIKGVVGWIDLSADDVEEKLELYSNNVLLKGFRHTVYDKEGEFMLQPKFLNGISILKKFGLTYDILVFDYQLPGAVELVKKFPDQKFVLDHMGKPPIYSEGPSPAWKENIQKLSQNKNVYCKLSGLVTETQDFQWKHEDIIPYLEYTVSCFGIERVMFGSDWPVCLPAASYKEVLGIVQSFFGNPKDIEKVLGGNAAEFYQI